MDRNAVYSLLVSAGLVVVTLIQIVRPGLNQDSRYVLGALSTTAAAGLSWTEAWAHRPMVARGVMALMDAITPDDPLWREIGIRFWSIVLVVITAAVLRHGLVPRVGKASALWMATAAGAALAWAPGWDFAEPEWYSVVFTVLAMGIALNFERPWVSAIATGVPLALAGLLKYTTLTNVIAALVMIAFLDHRKGLRAAIATGVLTVLLFGLTVLIEPHEWQWLWDMPTLNPPVTLAVIPDSIEGLANSVAVSPASLMAVLATAWVFFRGGWYRRWALTKLLAMGFLILPFLIQHQNFLYHLTPLPVFGAAATAAIAHRAVRTGTAVPIALPIVGALSFLLFSALFWLGPRTRDENWAVLLLAVFILLAIGITLLLVAPSGLMIRNDGRTSSGRGWLAMACLLPLLVTLGPWTTYSFSLAHNRVTADANREAIAQAGIVQDLVAPVVAPEAPVVYLAFSTPYWLQNPTPCRYASPTFLQRAVGPNAADIEQTRSFDENLACLDDPQAQFAVIETGWFKVDEANPRVVAALDRNFDCDSPVLDEGGLRICARR